jgi:TPR repeat protein
MKLKIIVSAIVIILLSVFFTDFFALEHTNPESLAEKSLMASQDSEFTKQPIKYPPLNADDTNKLNFARQAFKKEHYDVAFSEFKKIVSISSEAQFFVANMYEQGVGVAQNTRRAIRNYSSAADHGSVDAMIALGTLFSSGMLLGKNYKEAFRWFHQAAMAGDTEAQGRIALMYKNGQGISADIVSATAWLDISCAEETGNICSLREGFLLTPEQLKQSHLLTIKYKKMITQSASNSSYTRIK